MWIILQQKTEKLQISTKTNTDMIGIRTSEVERRVPVPGTRYEMQTGDRIVVRVQMYDGRQVNFVSTRLADMTEIIGEVRRLGRDCQGLARMSVRNTSRGWRIERPIKLYPDRHARRGLGLNRDMPLDSEYAPRMLMPWETH